MTLKRQPEAGTAQPRTLETRGRAMEGGLRVDAGGVEMLRQLALVELGVAGARCVPLK